MLQNKEISEENFLEATDILRFNLEEEYEMDHQSIRVRISESEKEIWDTRSMAASLLKTPGNKLEIIIPRINPYKIVHEIVAAILFSGKTDIELKTLKNAPYDPKEIPFLKMTPDFIINGWIVELGTSTARDENGLRSVFNKKFSDLNFKVKGANLSNLFSVLIVSQSGVYSNINLRPEEVDYISSAFIYAQKIFVKICIDFGLTEQEETENLKSKIGNLNSLLETIHLPYYKETPYISQRLDDHWSDRMSSFNKIQTVLGIAKFCLRESYKKFKKTDSKRLEIETFNNRLEQFRKKLSKSETRKDNKPPFQMPFFTSMIETSHVLLMNALTPYTRLWSSALLSGEPDKPDNDISERKEESQNWKQTSHRLYSKREIFVPFEDEIAFSLDGLYGKKNKDNEQMISIRGKSKLAFDLECDVSDIDYFLGDKIFLFSDCKSIDDPYYNMLSDANKQISDFYKSISRTKIMNYLSIMSRLFQELNEDLVKKTKRGEFIYKRLNNSNIYYISKTSSTTLFYSIMIIKDGTTDLNRYDCFQKPIFEDEKMCIYKFRSTNKNKISVMLKCFEDALALYSDLRSKSCYQDDADSDKLRLLFSIAIMIENKQTTSDTIYLIRQILVKLTSKNPYTDSGIILNKFSPFRSRFHVLVCKRIISAMSTMILRKPERISDINDDEDDDVNNRSDDSFRWLIDISTMRFEEKFEIAIYMSYCACFHSFATMSKTSADIKVIEKITDYEIKMRDADRENMGYNSKFEIMKPHEFNLDTSLLGGMLIRENLEGIYGEQTDNMIMKCFMENLKTTYKEFATFKASLERREKRLFGVVKSKNVKAIETCLAHFYSHPGNLISPYDDLRSFLKDIEEPIHAKVDKKLDQAAGLREILTMDINSRFCLKLIESTMEWINSHSKSEVLSKGSQKEKILEGFHKNVENLKEDGFDLIVIDQIIDHSKWCQMFVMTKFASHLKPILPDKLYKLFCVILNKVTSKRIFIHEDILKDFLNDNQYSSESITELKEQFLGRSERSDLLDKDCVDLKNESNMGQGWLQNLSGSDGNSDMMIVSLVLSCVIKVLISKGKIPADTTISCMDINSSDDQFSKKVIKIRKTHTKVLEGYIYMFTETPALVSNLNCKKMSEEKSELFHRQGVEEFNQIFRSGSTSFVGTCKFIRAANEIPVTTNMQDRFSNFSNTRRNALENGCDVFTCCVIQETQKRIHYRSLGLGIDPLFNVFYKILMDNKHPNFGFFPSEDSSLMCIGGNDFAKYILSKEQSSSKVFSNFLRRVDVSMGVNGDVGPSVTFRVTKQDRYKSFKTKFIDYSSQIENNPEILYIKTEMREHCEILLNDKALNSDAELSFVFDSTPKMMQSSSMFLRNPVFRYSRTVGDDIEMTQCNVFSLIAEFSGGRELTEAERKIIFPKSEVYESILGMKVDINSFSFLMSGDISRKRSTIRLDSVMSKPDISLLDCVKETWFALRTSHNRTLVKESFKVYKERLPWLRDTHDETLKANKLLFPSSRILYNMINSLEISANPVKIFSPLKQSSLERMIRNFIVYNFKRGHRGYTDTKHVPIFIRTDLDHKLRYRAYRICSGPYTMNDKLLELSNESLMLPSFYTSQNRSYRILSLISEILNDKNKISILEEILSLSKFIGFFRKEQKLNKENNTWEGDFIYDMMFESSHIRIEYLSGIPKIYTNNIISVKMHSLAIQKKISEFNLKSNRSFGIRLSGSSVLERQGALGIEICIDNTISYNLDPSLINLEVVLLNNGKILIKNSKASRPQTIFSEFLKRSDFIEYKFDSDDDWLENKPFKISKLKKMLEDTESKEWLKSLYKRLMDLRYMPERALEIFEEQIDYDEDIVKFLNEDFDFSEAMKDFEEEEIIETDDQMREAAFEIDIEEEQFDDFSYKRIDYNLKQNLALISDSRIFEDLNKNLDVIGLEALYKSKYRIDISYDTDEFWVFKELVDYDLREPKPRIRSSEIFDDEEIVVSSEARKKEVEGLRFATFGLPIRIDTSRPDGTYVKKRDKFYSFKPSTWMKGERKNELVRFFRDSIVGKPLSDREIEKDEEIFDKRTGEFKSKHYTEDSLKKKFQRYKSRFNREEPSTKLLFSDRTDEFLWGDIVDDEDLL